MSEIGIKETTYTASPTVLGALPILLLSVLWPFANFWAFNYTEGEHIVLERLVAAYFVSLFGLIPIFLIFHLMTLWRSAARSLYMTGVFGLMFFIYGAMASNLPDDENYLKIIVWVEVTGLLCVGTFFLAKFSLFRWTILCILPAISMTAIASALVERSSTELPNMPGHVKPGPDVTYKPWDGVKLIQPPAPPKIRPNVIFLLVDSIVRNDVFRKFYDSD